jgi:WD40 repeat protein
MAGQDSKKKSPVTLFFLAFAAIAILMFIARYRSVLLHELSAPGGTEKLSTCGEQLIAISVNNEIYSWLWKDLSEQPQISSVGAKKIVAMSSDRLLLVPPVANNLLILSNLKGDRELGALSLGENKKCKLLQASPNGKFAVAALVPAPVFQQEDAGGDSDKQVQLVIIDPNLTSVRPVETKTIEQGLQLIDIGISNDGNLIAAVGGGDKGWLFVAGANDKQLLWEHYVEDCKELNKVVFSLDGKMVYASESGRRVYIFDITAKKLVKRLEMDKYKTPPNNPQTISCIAVSPDGSLLAAASSPASKVWIWDIKTGEKIITIETGEFSICSIVFSPDSSLLAGTRGGDGPVKIWKVSK